MRYEKKYVSRQGQLDSVLLAMKSECASLVEQHQPRIVNSLYFENQDRLSTLDQIEGNSLRSKFRVRWYGVGSGIDQPILEIKAKTGHVGRKLKSKLAMTYVDIGDLAENAVDDIVDDSLRLRAKCLMLEPVLKVKYRRRYFLLNHQIRMTIDDGLTFSSLARNGQVPKIYESSDVIVEFKFSPESINMLPKLSQWTNLRYSKYSKFLSGMEMLGNREMARFYA